MHPAVSQAQRLLTKFLHKTGIRPIGPVHRPTIQLRTVFHGTEYGGWTLHPGALSANSIVYSFGIGEDASFDRALIQTYGLSLFAFDPTPRSIEWVKAQQWPRQFSFHPYGIAANDGAVHFYPPSDPANISYSVLTNDKRAGAPITVEMLRLGTIMRMLDHSQIDLLKMDIEGAEYQVLPDILDTPALSVRQILVEFHHSFPHISRADTKRAVKQLLAAGYELFHVAPNGNEYSFIRQ